VLQEASTRKGLQSHPVAEHANCELYGPVHVTRYQAGVSHRQPWCVAPGALALSRTFRAGMGLPYL
jgi:hypothetical protein